MPKVTFNSLLESGNRVIIKNMISEQIKIIDAKIFAANNNGFNSIVHELPNNFSINNIDKSDAQIIVYSDILTIFTSKEPEGKGFKNVKIEFLDSRALLHVQWINGITDNERASRKNIISQCLYKK